jgi:hypothetical protein
MIINQAVLDANWGPEYLASMVLLRRGSELTLYYYRDLVKMSRGEILPSSAADSKSIRSIHIGRAAAALVRLRELLTVEQWEALTK